MRSDGMQRQLERVPSDSSDGRSSSPDDEHPRVQMRPSVARPPSTTRPSTTRRRRSVHEPTIKSPLILQMWNGMQHRRPSAAIVLHNCSIVEGGAIEISTDISIFQIAERAEKQKNTHGSESTSKIMNSNFAKAHAHIGGVQEPIQKGWQISPISSSTKSASLHVVYLIDSGVISEAFTVEASPDVSYLVC